MFLRKIDGTGPGAVEVWQWKAVVEMKVHRGRTLEKVGKRPLYTRMWEYFSLARAKANKFLRDAEKEQQEGIQG